MVESAAVAPGVGVIKLCSVTFGELCKSLIHFQPARIDVRFMSGSYTQN